METDENNETIKTSILEVVMDWIVTLCPLIVGVIEFAFGNFFSGVGWLFAGVGWITAIEEREWVETFIGLYRKHLDKCEKRDRAYKEKIQEYENKYGLGKEDK